MNAQKISGASLMCSTPSAAITANHTSMTGPNSAPTRAVPRDCTMKSAMRMTTLIIMTSSVVTLGPSPGMVFSPSSAPSTETAGVMMLSP